MVNFLELLKAVCGHDNEVLMVIRGIGCSFSLLLPIKDYKYIPSENTLKLSTETSDSGCFWFENIYQVERGLEYDDEPDYKIYYKGGQADLTFMLY
ncbi:hypothetical protein [Enterocloster citroniae]|mgnify:CR=1 FL=1|uniref:Uncharacterized protein n=1 Tax=[Clostridium] citroniae WAL-17108 TaxID=742733 RepID=G5HE79_9FIRM|nr:hypothetical protein [Enterocloster citroniae]EHF00306.1 hypothetical protein HMPREF9469_00891 [ [[Clostridium] citroniae WAL-17108]MCC3383244.1 hypothetical protein [Enterocloster citroniae]